MSVAHCMHHALAIAATPDATWKDQIAEVPTGCAHDDCGKPNDCRQRVAEYLRMQYRSKRHRQHMKDVAKS